jgi:hypothetical protein
MGVVTTIFGRAGAAFLVAAAIAALALAVTLHAWEQFQTLGRGETRPAEGYTLHWQPQGLPSLPHWRRGWTGSAGNRLQHAQDA